ncbi:TonB-dependent receptor [Roseateles asaccharophilus]|uniref:TonB-dependent receptor n=2 Tax=Roseateles asaccharophilus TaxID=582607 RepID=A0ABU2A3B5_9BURK|nr:TonB-dependent receptor [Roseateles asaccharophilus]MDR7331682.1 TonB-dependent receptor [Roseateles asaccharophilus]
MRHQAQRARLKPIAWASSVTLLAGVSAVQAQQVPAAPTALETVVITGIRKSLDSAVTLKRESRGLVDGIVAEDIGKFPDTNLAESMQRIAGVSIDRNSSGEGSKVTVRGVGPDFNMVLLNGRQMPTAVINPLNQGASGSRAFDFANLSSDSISALEVFKTARSETPTGGIGATINVKTARPLDVRERIASVGIKANFDDSNNRLPESFKGDKVTPEISGIYSDTFGNRTLGIAISGSYSKRASGSNNAYTQNGWHTNNPNVMNVVPSSNIPVKPTGLYATTNDMRYSITALDRERLNGQVTLQFAPTKDLKFTVDHTMAVNTVKAKNSENSAWFNNEFSGPLGSSPATKFTTGPVQAPIVQTVVWNGTHDYGMNIGQFAQKSKLDSTGFNVDWKVSDALRFELDAHHSKAKTTPDSPYGTYAILDLALFNQGNITAYYDKDLPIMQSPGLVYDANKTTVTGSQFNSNLSDQGVDQVQLRGTYRLSADDKLIAGLGFSKLKNRSASVNNFHGDWSGVGPQGSFKNVPVAIDSLGGFFSRIPGHDDPRLFPHFFTPDFNGVLKQAIANSQVSGTQSTGNVPFTKERAEAYFRALTDYSTGNDWRTTEKSTSAFGQWDHSFDTAVPMNVSVGLRYESTKVESASQVISYSGTNWNAENEVILTGGTSSFGSKSGKYNYWLPSIDWDADLTDKIKVRASYGVNIGRPGWDQMLGGITLNQVANRSTGGNGSTGDPALKPLKSKNLDLSAEFYYAKSSYAAVGAFYKKVSDFIGATTVTTTVPGLNQPASGTCYNAARAAGHTTAIAIRNYIFNNCNGQSGVTITNGSNPAFIIGDITGAVAGAQPMVFQINSYANGAGDNIKGLELNFQHMFGNSGFGVSGNYTYVKSGLNFNNASTGTQAPLPGLSDSANLVGFYENESWSIRAAYNWRDKFLAARTYDNANDPIYTEAYGQVDMSIGYKIGKNLTLQADLLNLNDGYIRQHSRTKEMLVSAQQTGRRYLIGARYRF